MTSQKLPMIELEAGQRYLTRDGEVIEIISVDTNAPIWTASFRVLTGRYRGLDSRSYDGRLDRFGRSRQERDGRFVDCLNDVVAKA